MQRHDDRRAQIAEKQDEQHDDQRDGFEQDFLHGPDGFFDQFAAVVEYLDMRAFRQARRQADEPCLHALDDNPRVGAAQTEHQPPNRFAFAIARDDTVSRQGAIAHFGDVADAHDAGRTCGDHHGFDVVERSQPALRRAPATPPRRRGRGRRRRCDYFRRARCRASPP